MTKQVGAAECASPSACYLVNANPLPLAWGKRERAVITIFHHFSPVCGVLLKLMLCRRNTTSTGVLLLVSKMETHPHKRRYGMIVEKVSLAVLAVFGVVGLACFFATALGVLPIISTS
jgi:hypothetical protein